ncbi:small ribosomal subunit protein mS31 [Euwallacea fornicatus]|uniref:small ribosomal subunit protein mS31 n=1 Tax=Euwallacea fornicatus TaxID=995702 RepID=UPI00338D86FC
MSQAILRKLPAQPPWISLLMQRPVSTSLLRQKTTKGPINTSSSSSSDSDDNIKEAPKSPSEAITRLNTLLEHMTSTNYTKTIQLSQPKNKRAQGRKEKESVKTESVEKQVVNAVKGVAECLPGDKKQTESELLMKLLNPVQQTSEKQASLSEILKGMKIEREEKPQQSKAEYVRNVLKRFENPVTNLERHDGQRKPKRPSVIMPKPIQPEPMELFCGESLGIFTNSEELKESPQLATWQKLYEKELKLAVTHPPANYFQEMILWTEQGKFWQFPINNEFGLEEESKVYFTEHVFLEEHLEPWCPPKGPIRHFMELVCVGLSKNSYLTVQAKKEHIEWFRNYFEDKKGLLQEVGALIDVDAKAPSVDVEK